MAKNEALNFTQEINNKGVTIANADASTVKTIYTGAGNDAVVKGLTVCSSDSSARILQFYFNDGTADFFLGAVSIPAGSGTNGTASNVDILGALSGLANDAYGKRILLMNSGSILKVKSTTTVTSSTQIDILAQIEEY